MVLLKIKFCETKSFILSIIYFTITIRWNKTNFKATDYSSNLHYYSEVFFRITMVMVMRNKNGTKIQGVGVSPSSNHTHSHSSFERFCIENWCYAWLSTRIKRPADILEWAEKLGRNYDLPLLPLDINKNRISSVGQDLKMLINFSTKLQMKGNCCWREYCFFVRKSSSIRSVLVAEIIESVSLRSTSISVFGTAGHRFNRIRDEEFLQ